MKNIFLLKKRNSELWGENKLETPASQKHGSQTAQHLTRQSGHLAAEHKEEPNARGYNHPLLLHLLLTNPISSSSP